MHRRGGNVAYISHSGSGMCGIVDSEERIDFNLVVSTGQELAVSMDEYLDYALEMPGTRAVGLFMETARDPAGLVRAFERARERGIPVVALKVGRTELSAKLTVSHSGAIAGEDAVYDAIFDRYGVHRARDMDELATSLILFAQPHRVGDGGLVSIHDSGGERQLLIDLASDHDVPLTQLSPASTQHLESLLDPGLPAVNPARRLEHGRARLRRRHAELPRRAHERPAGGARRRGARPRRGRRHPRRLHRLPARRPPCLRQAGHPGGEPPGHRRGPADRRGDARGLSGRRRARILPARRAPPPRSSRLRGARPLGRAGDPGDRARAHARAPRRPAPLRRERRADAARRRRPAGQCRHHRRGRGPGHRGGRSHRLPGRAQDGEARPRPQERPAGHPPRRSRTRRRSRSPTATSPSASTRACWSRR